MNIIFECKFLEAQTVMILLILVSEDKKIIDKILSGKSVTRITNSIVNVTTDLVAAQIWGRLKLDKTVLGDWTFSHTNGGKYYYRFTPKFEVNKLVYEVQDQNSGEYYGYYTFNNYKKL